MFSDQLSFPSPSHPWDLSLGLKCDWFPSPPAAITSIAYSHSAGAPPPVPRWWTAGTWLIPRVWDFHICSSSCCRKLGFFFPLILCLAQDQRSTKEREEAEDCPCLPSLALDLKVPRAQPCPWVCPGRAESNLLGSGEDKWDEELGNQLSLEPPLHINQIKLLLAQPCT